MVPPRVKITAVLKSACFHVQRNVSLNVELSKLLYKTMLAMVDEKKIRMISLHENSGHNVNSGRN